MASLGERVPEAEGNVHAGDAAGHRRLDAFRELKRVHIDYVMERKNYWYPYRDRKPPAHG